MKYTAELQTHTHLSGGYTLRLEVLCGNQVYGAERDILPGELTFQGMFDLVFDDLKSRLKEDLMNMTIRKK